MALMLRSILFALVMVAFGLAASGCIDEHKPAQNPTPEHSEEQEYANTPTTGPGSETSSGYYGVGNTETPQHQPATPSQGGHQPY